MSSPASSIQSLFPREPGTYLLLLRLSDPLRIPIGRLGQFDFPAGFYLYVGSAFGPGGLAGRLNRHLALATSEDWPGRRRQHWHIDYLSHHARLSQVWFSVHDRKREHDWAALIRALSGAAMPAPRFGASDCRCPAHLFHFQRLPSFETFRQLLGRHFPSDALVQQNLRHRPVRVTI